MVGEGRRGLVLDVFEIIGFQLGDRIDSRASRWHPCRQDGAMGVGDAKRWRLNR